MNENWEGTVTTPGIKEGKDSIPTKCELKITQTFSKINIKLETNCSLSKTIIAGMTLSDSQQIEINFAYRRESKGPERVSIKRSEGYNSLRLITDEDGKRILEGNYFSDVIHERKNKPHFGFVKVKKI